MATLGLQGAAMTSTRAGSAPTDTDRRAALTAAYNHAAEVVAGVRAAQLSGPTPCPEYNVATLIDHLVGAGWRAIEIGRGQTPSGEEFPHVDLADAPGQLCEAGAEAPATWTDDRLAATTTMPWGETYTGATLVDMYLCELMAHSWDLSMATGQTPHCDPTLATAALNAAHAMLRPEYRDMLSTGNPYGAEQPTHHDATTIDRFAAFVGRPLTWQP